MKATSRGWFHLASGAGVGRILGFASNLLLSRWLGPSELGLFNLATTTVQTSDTLVRCGGDYALNFELGSKSDAMMTDRGVELAQGLAQLCSLMTALICIGVSIWVGCYQGLFPTSSISDQRFLLTFLLVLMIACEGISSSAWETLLVSHRTALLALRQGLFFPLRLLFAATCALAGGVIGAMSGWSFIALVQCIWLKKALGHLWNPLQMFPFLRGRLYQLLRLGFPFYASNILASLLFYPLLLKVATGSGISEIGYLRVGQILQQLFAFLPSTLVPVLFLRLRRESSFEGQVSVMERPLRLIWFILLQILLIYSIFDQLLIVRLFGSQFISALLPTRLLLITALFESLAQLVVQPLLAAGKMRLYGFWQNGAALFSAVLGWLWIPSFGLSAYLVVRLIYVLFPLIGFGLPVVKQLHKPWKMLPPTLVSLGLLLLLLLQTFNGYDFESSPFLLALSSVTLPLFYYEDLLLLKQVLIRA